MDAVDTICFCFNLRPKEEEDEETLQGLINKKYDELQRASLVGELVFLTIYVISCVIVFFVNYASNDFFVPISLTISTIGTKQALIEAGLDFFVQYVPVAKGFGHTLNYTCAIIVLPVSRTVIRYILELSNNRTAFANCLRGILFFIPLDKALEFHKVIAWTIYVSAIGHT
jgi:hypothetical protein